MMYILSLNPVSMVSEKKKNHKISIYHGFTNNRNSRTLHMIKPNHEISSIIHLLINPFICLSFPSNRYLIISFIYTNRFILIRVMVNLKNSVHNAGTHPVKEINCRERSYKHSLTPRGNLA